jgi:hypothetical protein
MSLSFNKTNGKINIYDHNNGYQTRHIAVIKCILEADKIYNWVDFDYITINTNDKENNINEYTFSKNNSFYRTIPDFNFDSWPESGVYDYENTINDIVRAGCNKYEVNKVGWIGNLNTNYIRKLLYNIGKKYNDKYDIMSIKWNNDYKNTTNFISMPELVKKYSILIDVEGVGYSGRLKYLLWSHRPVIIVDRPHKEFFFEYLVDWVHYIPVKRDLSDIIEKTDWIFNNYDKATTISDNAYNFANKYLTRIACYEQWNKIILNHINDTNNK